MRTLTIAPLGLRAALVAGAIAAVVLALPAQAKPAPKPGPAAAPAGPKGPTLDRIKANQAIRLGYRTDARPFSFKDGSGNPSGYSVALCRNVATAIQQALGLQKMDVTWVPVDVMQRFQAVQQGGVDIFCGADTRTIARIQDVTFSLPIYPGGIGAMVRSDAPARLVQVLSNKPRTEPVWRASAGQLLTAQTFTVVEGTTAQPWLAGKLSTFQLQANVVTAKTYDEGLLALLDRKSNVFFADRAILLDYAQRQTPKGQLTVIDRNFTYETYSLTMARGDGELRVIVDRTLARFYATPAFWSLYEQWFGAPDAAEKAFFAWTALPE